MGNDCERDRRCVICGLAFRRSTRRGTSGSLSIADISLDDYRGLAAFVGWKYAQRRRFLRSLRVARITPEQLKAELDSGADLVVVDLRHALEDEAEPRTLPGAMRLTAEKLEERGGELPQGKTLVLYCS